MNAPVRDPPINGLDEARRFAELLIEAFQPDAPSMDLQGVLLDDFPATERPVVYQALEIVRVHQRVDWLIADLEIRTLRAEVAALRRRGATP